MNLQCLRAIVCEMFSHLDAQNRPAMVNVGEKPITKRTAHAIAVVTLPDALTEWRRHNASDSIRARSRNLQIKQTLMRTQVFNCFCRRQGLRTISAWRNTRFYKQLLRFSLPELAYALFYNYWKPRARRSVRTG